jgi:lambda family phage holin
MPEKDPNNWAALWDAVSNSATWQGAIMASIIAFLRVLYDGKETRWTRIGLESLICGALSLCASSGLSFFGAPESLSVAVGGSIGFLGVATIREFLVRWAGKRVDG